MIILVFKYLAPPRLTTLPKDQITQETLDAEVFTYRIIFILFNFL